ncbi:MAG: phosphoribosylaminoimidazolesuccinocarboxamide synthase [Verrucomicrobiae bacterium]|nr:phosphoribosylaminoimidazolesuccinocarboxamide synthase [Verrucomicrobiae bacterium]MDW8343466.1 phosphoribosylaminoimidazolesuccinocarboxamide synthase [Verrucomicrobiae bacterium]
MSNTITQVELPGIPKLKSGKVREVFDLGDALLFVATDRISAFDVILPDPIPEKGRVLTALSEFWFTRTRALVENHFLTADPHVIAARIGTRPELVGRAMLVRKCRPLPIECVVRGYLAGSGWKEYRQTGQVCGVPLPPGLPESAELPHPIFTPATKAEQGHDLNITFDEAARLVGLDVARQVRDRALMLYLFARDYARQRGILIADTKFEFGFDGDRLVLIDEVLTPDSSRFWPADQYKPGGPQPSFDKQFVRDYLETLPWNKQPPAPRLPAEVIARTSEKYLEALARLTR